MSQDEDTGFRPVHGRRPSGPPARRPTEAASPFRRASGMLVGRRNGARPPSHRKESPMRKVPTWSLGLFLVLAIPTSAVDASQPPGGAAAPGGRVLEIRVVERAGGKPVAGVAILTKSGRQGGPKSRGTTDD